MDRRQVKARSSWKPWLSRSSCHTPDVHRRVHVRASPTGSAGGGAWVLVASAVSRVGTTGSIDKVGDLEPLCDGHAQACTRARERVSDSVRPARPMRLAFRPGVPRPRSS
jgi:hypothetical protein